MSTSCCLVAKTHRGSGAASTERTKASSVDILSLQSLIISASVSDDSSVLFTVFFALYTCWRFLGKSQPVLAFITPPWSFSMLVRTLVADLYSESFLMRFKILGFVRRKRQRLDFFLCSYREMSTGFRLYMFMVFKQILNKGQPERFSSTMVCKKSNDL